MNCENCNKVIKGRSKKIDDMVVCSKCKKEWDKDDWVEEDMYDY